MERLKLRVKNYKTFRYIEIELSPVTVLIGPPASGKSNLLDALGLLGFLGKAAAASLNYPGGYWGHFCEAETQPLSMLRISDVLDVYPFREYDGKPAEIILMDQGSGKTFSLALTAEGDKLKGTYRAKDGTFRLTLYSQEEPFSCSTDYIEEFANFSRAKNFPEARLYGFERYGLGRGLYEPTSGIISCSVEYCMPMYVLSEKGYNMAYMAVSSPALLREVNQWLREELEEPLRVVGLAESGEYRVAFLVGDVAVPSAAISDTMLRILYYLLALYTTRRYAAQHGRKPILLLEEPEARVFPYSFQLIAKHIYEAQRIGVNVVLTTHNGLLVSKLLETVPKDNIAVHYLYLDDEGYTRSLRIDLEALARRLMLTTDLMIIRPSEVLQELAEAQG